MATDYQKHLPEITTVYRQATHWHGTGRYRHERMKDSGDRENRSTVSDILVGIVESGGLHPYKDPWIDSGGKTVSLATVRMLSRTFARIHANEHSTFVYELGSIKFWLRLYFFLFSVWLCTDRRARSMVARSFFQGSFFRDIQIWESAIRRPDKRKTVTVLNGFQKQIQVSDIEGNYPILFGIVAETKDLVETTLIARKVERRSLKPITMQQFTHIEVPLQNVVETEKILKDNGITLTVIPLEFGDMYLANQPLDKLAYS
ncbi:MAG: hypothetical protein AAB421_01670 [Patescibacteria group bacterium]